MQRMKALVNLVALSVAAGAVVGGGVGFLAYVATRMV